MTNGWNVIDADAGVLWREYLFTKNGVATTLVFRGTDGLVVVSPGTGLSSADYEALRPFGEVRALIANNTLHTLGQRPWHEHFKNVVSYCPPRAVDKMNRILNGIAFRPLTELALPDNVHWEDPPGFKTGEAILSVGTAKGSVWYTGDLLTNIPKLPPPPFKWLLGWTDSAPGFRLFKPAVWLAVNDKPALKSWMLRRLSEEPPAVVVPAHGAPVEGADVAALAKAQIARL